MGMAEVPQGPESWLLSSDGASRRGGHEGFWWHLSITPYSDPSLPQPVMVILLLFPVTGVGRTRRGVLEERQSWERS